MFDIQHVLVHRVDVQETTPTGTLTGQVPLISDATAGGAVVRPEHIWGSAAVTRLPSPVGLVYLGVTLRGRSEAHRGVATVVTLGMVLRLLTTLRPDVSDVPPARSHTFM